MPSDARPQPPERVKVAGDLYHPQVPPGAVYVGRPAPGLRGSRFANPHRVSGACRRCGTEHHRAAAVLAYASDLAADPQLLDAARAELAGADLACWCPLDAHPCHADVLLAVAAGADPVTACRALLDHGGRDSPSG